MKSRKTICKKSEKHFHEYTSYAANQSNGATYDWFIFRYAETLLIYAEALAELGGSSDSEIENAINQLRSRLDESDNGFEMGRFKISDIGNRLPLGNSILHNSSKNPASRRYSISNILR